MIRNRLFTFITAIICLVLIPAAFHTACGESSSDPSRPEDLKVTFSEEAGANITGKTVELYAPAGCTVWYTTDGSDPAEGSSNRYTAPLSLTPRPSRFAAESDSINLTPYRIYDPEGLPQAVTVKAIAAAPDGPASPVAVRTYFFQDIEPVTVISIATDYDNLLDNETGIMVKGAIYDSWAGTEEAKYYMDRGMLWEYQGNYSQKGKAWERPASIEIFDGSEYITGYCGIRLCGHYSRVLAQKSFNIYFRKDYGTKELKYPLFPDAVSADGSTLTAYKSFKLRSGGNHTEFLKFPDTMIQYLVRDLDFSTQSARPAILYLNGEYMGIYVMTEKIQRQLHRRSLRRG